MASNKPQFKTKPASLGFGIAACSAVMNAAGEIQLTPSGQFRGVDGRPKDAANWLIDEQAAKDVISFCSARVNPFVIDYEHQTMLTADNGQPAPAAGWFSGTALRWSAGEGLFVKPDWTQRAQDYIASGEYKFISPVILYEKVTGRVKGILSAALTNNACIDGMDDVLSRAAASFLLDESTSQESLTMDMDELLEQLRWMFNLPTLATPEDVMAELQKAVAAIKAAAPDATAAANFSVVNLVSSLNTQVVALKSATPDPSKFVPVDVMVALQAEVAQLRGNGVDSEIDGLVVAALSAGKLLPVQEKWARELGKSNLSLLKQHIEGAPGIAALTATQTQGKPPVVQPQNELTDAEIAMCRNMGTNPEDFKKTKLSIAQA